MKPVCIWVISDVLCQVSTRHPFRDELERAGGNGEEREDVLVLQAFPHDSLLVEGLWALLATGNEKMRSVKGLFSRVGSVRRVHPNPFDANL